MRAARRVRDALCRLRPRICALGREPAAPSGDQLVPPVVVKNAPMSVPTYRVLCVESAGSIKMELTGMSGRLPVMSVQAVAAPAVPFMVLNMCPMGGEQNVAHVPNPEKVA